MMTINKSNAVLVLVVVAALAVASVVAVHGHGAPASAMATTAIDNPAAAGLADTSAATSSTSGVASAADPAKQEPTLDQFTSRDPFIQVASGTVAASGSTATPTAEASPVAADISVKFGAVPAKTYRDQQVGDGLPPAPPAFTVKLIQSGGVTFELVGDYTINGQANDKTFEVLTGDTKQLTLDKGTTQTTYVITVLDLVYNNSGSSGSSSSSGSGSSSSSGSGSSSSSGSSSDTSSSSYAGHSIKALSIETANGVPSATIVVDGTTYAARKVGAIISTSWGQIKILGINSPAQTVTVLHGDVQVTLHVGQSVSK